MLRMRDARAGTDNRAPAEDDGRAVRAAREPQSHRTVDRVTQILEEVVYKPGMTFAELARALSAPKSSVSLTVIAERITGAHWSGPRFFSLTKRARTSLPTETDQ